MKTRTPQGPKRVRLCQRGGGVNLVSRCPAGRVIGQRQLKSANRYSGVDSLPLHAREHIDRIALTSSGRRGLLRFNVINDWHAGTGRLQTLLELGSALTLPHGSIRTIGGTTKLLRLKQRRGKIKRGVHGWCRARAKPIGT